MKNFSNIIATIVLFGMSSAYAEEPAEMDKEHANYAEEAPEASVSEKSAASKFESPTSYIGYAKEPYGNPIAGGQEIRQRALRRAMDRCKQVGNVSCIIVEESHTGVDERGFMSWTIQVAGFKRTYIRYSDKSAYTTQGGFLLNVEMRGEARTKARQACEMINGPKNCKELQTEIDFYKADGVLGGQRRRGKSIFVAK